MSIDLVAGIFGARGSGKSHTAKQFLLTKPPRVLIVDPMDEFGDHARRCDTLPEVVKLSAEKSFALRYVPRIENVPADVLREVFCSLCAIAWARGDLVFMVDEGQLFTRAQAAPADWSNLTLRGRHRAIRIFCLSQRPAHIDKDFFSNATFVRSGRLNFADDIATMANALRVPAAVVSSLIGREWIGRDLLNGNLSCEPADALERGKPAALPVATPEPPTKADPKPARKPARAKKTSKKSRRTRRTP